MGAATDPGGAPSALPCTSFERLLPLNTGNASTGVMYCVATPAIATWESTINSAFSCSSLHKACAFAAFTKSVDGVALGLAPAEFGYTYVQADTGGSGRFIGGGCKSACPAP
jgi:hypothetical protein